MKHRYIAIEGPIGVGKTSLAKMLADELDARLVLEAVEDNPFLEKFYESRERMAFQTQLFFLLSRHQAQKELIQRDLFQEVIVADYIFEKDRIFAQINLSDDEFALYEQIYALLDHQIPRPDLVIFLQATPRVLIDRVRRRNKSYEKPLEVKYIETLCQAYTSFFFNYSASPLLVVNTDAIDFVKNRSDFEALRKEIGLFRKGVQYFNPLGSR